MKARSALILFFLTGMLLTMGPVQFAQGGISLGSFTTDAAGVLKAAINIPVGTPPGTYLLTAVGAISLSGGSGSYPSGEGGLGLSATTVKVGASLSVSSGGWAKTAAIAVNLETAATQTMGARAVQNVTSALGMAGTASAQTNRVLTARITVEPAAGAGVPAAPQAGAAGQLGAAAATPKAAAAPKKATAKAKGLASTGTNVWPKLAVGTFALALGAALVVIGRRQLAGRGAGPPSERG